MCRDGVVNLQLPNIVEQRAETDEMEVRRPEMEHLTHPHRHRRSPDDMVAGDRVLCLERRHEAVHERFEPECEGRQRLVRDQGTDHVFTAAATCTETSATQMATHCHNHGRVCAEGILGTILTIDRSPAALEQPTAGFSSVTEPAACKDHRTSRTECR